jgi:hypothetical protein
MRARSCTFITHPSRTRHTVLATVERVYAVADRDEPERASGDEAGRVLRRLARIEALDRQRAPAGRMLGELRELVREAEAWARLEGDLRARTAVGKLREEAEGMS